MGWVQEVKGSEVPDYDFPEKQLFSNKYLKGPKEKEYGRKYSTTGLMQSPYCFLPNWLAQNTLTE